MSRSQPTVLLTLGRLPKALELARCLYQAGCRVVVAEPFRWHLCRPSRAVAASYQVTAPNTDRSRYLGELRDIVRREDVQLVLPVSEEALHVSALIDILPPHVHVLCAPFEELLQLHDKKAFAELATGMGLAVPPTYPEDSAEAADLIANSDYVAKPAHSCSGIGVEICLDGDRHTPGGTDVLVQKHVDGDHVSSLSLLDKGSEIATVVYRGTVFAGTVAICFERVDMAPTVREWITRFAEQSDYSGFVAFDFIVDAQSRAWAIECNPRPTSGVHFFDSADLAKAILSPHGVESVALKPVDRMQWAYSTLTEAYAAMFKPEKRRHRFRQLFAARDVVWSLSDPLPFLLMTPMSWEILWPAMTTDLSLGEATQRDIAWLSG